MGRKDARHAFRVLCVKDNQVYYIQIEKDGKRNKHFFKNPISYEKYQQEKHLKPKVEKTSDNTTPSIENCCNSEPIDSTPIKLPNTQNLIPRNLLLNNPSYEMDRKFIYDSDDSDDDEDQFKFDAESLYKSQSFLEGSFYTYDSTAFYPNDQQ